MFEREKQEARQQVHFPQFVPLNRTHKKQWMVKFVIQQLLSAIIYGMIQKKYKEPTDVEK